MLFRINGKLDLILRNQAGQTGLLNSLLSKVTAMATAQENFNTALTRALQDVSDENAEMKDLLQQLVAAKASGNDAAFQTAADALNASAQTQEDAIAAAKAAAPGAARAP